MFPCRETYGFATENIWFRKGKRKKEDLGFSTPPFRFPQKLDDN